MISEKMASLGEKRSVIRDIFEYAKQRASQIGAENIFDFSIGNPSVPAPESVNRVIKELVDNTDSVTLHGYTSAQGDAGVRKTICDSINKRFGTSLTPDLIYMTAGAAASLTITLNALTVPGDEFIAFTPFFPEYRVFTEAAGASLVAVPSREKDFQIDFDALEAAITKNTKGIIINSPNNPSGVVLRAETIAALADFLRGKSSQFGHVIYLISDEPYRELVYDYIEVPYVMNYYDNSIVCYSYSKALSLPGERIGYIAVCDKAENCRHLYAAVCGAGRALGYVCAPSLFQRVAAICEGETADISVYKRNRDLLYGALTSYGFCCVKPDGAFYLFVKAAESDASAFCERAKKYELLLVPAESFGCPGFVRIAYCVKTETIERALAAFKKLAQEYGLQG